MREVKKLRKTNETNIEIYLNLDGNSNSKINTGIGFLDHMLELFAFHSSCDLEVFCVGDLNVDDHHSIEDIGIVLGECIKEALGEKRGINRYASFDMPMDETLLHVALDISGRPFLVFNCDFKYDKVGEMSVQMVEEFFRALVQNSGITLHVNLMYGKNDHHKIEAIFKGFARSIKHAVICDLENSKIQSSKGIL